MRRMILVAVVGALMIALTASVALAATIIGTDGKDELRGTNGADVIKALAGSDFLDGRGGDDTLRGNGGSDFVFGNSGDDRIFGGPGNDASRRIFVGLNGGEGNDFVSGGGGGDILTSESGRDLLEGGAGDDSFNSTSGSSGDNPNSKDRIFCGPGFDTVVADKADIVADDCEDVAFARDAS